MRSDVQIDCEDQPLRVAMSSEILETVVGGLLDNARQHAGAMARIAVGLRRAEDGFVEIVVSDDGRGIAAADRERVFEPFFTTARATGGTGLGLAILRAVLKAHGGVIELLPSARGARFRVTVPLASA